MRIKIHKNLRRDAPPGIGGAPGFALIFALGTRIYELSGNGRQLNVTTQLESPRFDQPVNIQFVYGPGRPSGD